MNGPADFTGLTNLANQLPWHNQFFFTDVTCVRDGRSFTINGRKGINHMMSPSILLLSYLKEDDNTGISYWIKDYFIPLTDGPDYVEIMWINYGRFYDPDYGYVVLSVEETIRTYDSDEWASSGKLILTGAEGTQGGNTKIRITYLSATEYLVEADTNGDGAYDYNSGTLLFADLP